MKISIINLGCKVNKYESDSIASSLLELGFEVIQDFSYADVYIVNTCAVTNEAEKKSRQMVSKCVSFNKNAKILVLGCASQNNKEQFNKNKDNIIFVGGTCRKMQVVNIISNLNKDNCVKEDLNIDSSYSNEYKGSYSKIRSYLKIQDGCNNFCSYCLIPYVRGRSRSRDLNSIYNEALYLSDKTKEIVLTGINISDYRINNELALDKLVDRIKGIPVRFRFGSFEMNILTEEFLKKMSENKNFCPHFHISLQSGSNSVLKKMNRKYTKEQFYETIKLIKKYFNNPAFTTDVIVGACEESDEEFNESYDFIKKVGFMDMHIFPYSRREGTVACNYKLINGEIIKKRINKLEELRKILFKNYIDDCKDGIYELLIEEFDGEYYIGHTENYIKVYIKEKVNINEMYNVKFDTIFKDGVCGNLV